MKALKNKQNCKIHPVEASLSYANLLEEETESSPFLSYLCFGMDSVSETNVKLFVSETSLQERRLTFEGRTLYPYKYIQAHF